MTQARKQLVDITTAGLFRLGETSNTDSYHCIERCVRRSWLCGWLGCVAGLVVWLAWLCGLVVWLGCVAWLCGWDRYLKKSFTHRKDWVEARLKQLGEIFAGGIYSYAI